MLLAGFSCKPPSNLDIFDCSSYHMAELQTPAFRSNHLVAQSVFDGAGADGLLRGFGPLQPKPSGTVSVSGAVTSDADARTLDRREKDGVPLSGH